MQGLLPSSITITACWAFLLIEALLLVEINVGLLRKKKRRITEEDNDQLEVISLRTMAQETLGEWGGALATVTYVFLGYTSMVAYTSKSGEILYNLINLPKSILGFFFTVLFTLLISVGGTRATDRVNQWLTVSMIGTKFYCPSLKVLKFCLSYPNGFESGNIDGIQMLMENDTAEYHTRITYCSFLLVDNKGSNSGHCMNK